MNRATIMTVITVVVLVIIAGFVLPSFIDGVSELGEDASDDGKTSSLFGNSITAIIFVFFIIVVLIIVYEVVKLA